MTTRLVSITWTVEQQGIVDRHGGKRSELIRSALRAYDDANRRSRKLTLKEKLVRIRALVSDTD